MEQRPVLACRFVSPQTLPPARRELWDRTVEQALAEGHEAPRVYPGSVFVPCEQCGERVAVGPRQQHLLGVAEVLCMLCAAQAMNEADSSSIVSFDNPAFGQSADDDGLADHIVSHQLYPRFLAAQLTEEGIPVHVEMVNTTPGAAGYTITCAGCGRTAKAQTKPSDGYKAYCPDCARAARES